MPSLSPSRIDLFARLLLTLLLCSALSVWQCHSFLWTPQRVRNIWTQHVLRQRRRRNHPHSRKQLRPSPWLSLKDQEDSLLEQAQPSKDTSSSSSWQWNASASFGSLLLQLQKKEEANRADHNETLLNSDFLDLDHPGHQQPPTPPTLDDESKRTPHKQSDQKTDESNNIATKDNVKQELSVEFESGKELDNLVFPLSNDLISTENLKNDLEVLPLSPLYQAVARHVTTTEAEEGIVTYRREKSLTDRMDRDLRHLAVNIAASIETVDQWRLFCQERGGLYPLLETIRQGARALAQQESNKTKRKKTLWRGRKEGKLLEESFVAACIACRAIRDICALSPEVAAVVTDGILRANAVWKGGLMGDFCAFLKYANDYKETSSSLSSSLLNDDETKSTFRKRRQRSREARLRCKLYVTQLLLAMTFASDDAVTAIREAPELQDAILASSSYARIEQTRRWLRYPAKLVLYFWRYTTDKKARGRLRRPFLQNVNLGKDLNGQVQKTSNLLLAAIGCNRWVPKVPGQKGLRILCLDGGGSRGMAAVTAVHALMEHVGEDLDVANSFDIVAGTSTGGIIGFLTGLRGESSEMAVKRYNQLIKQIFVKSALNTPRMMLTTATYDESHFMEILSGILGDETMLDSRANPAFPLVFCVTSKMSSTPTHVALFRNYNYASGELADHFTIDPDQARRDMELPLELEHESIRSGSYFRNQMQTSSPGVRMSDGSRHPGSFRVLQRYALRASTAAPTVFKPVMMGGEMYCDGGIVASNPAAIAIHEARTLFPDVPIEMVVSVGTGGFLEQKSSPRIGWDGIIGQIVGSATDGEQIHHILEDILGDPAVFGRGTSVSRTKYFRFNPVIGKPDEFPIDVTDPEKLEKLRQITRQYMAEPEQQAKMDDVADILKKRPRWSRMFTKRR